MRLKLILNKPKKMPRNIEIKATITSKEKAKELHRILEKICDFPTEVLEQKDTFFNAENGRLKLREFINHSTSTEEVFKHFSC